MPEESLGSQFAAEGSLRLALLLGAESTALPDVIDEYFSVNTLFVLPVGIRGQRGQTWPAFHFRSQSVPWVHPLCLHLFVLC